MSTIDLKIEFSGGLELLFGNQRRHTLSIPSNASPPRSTGSSHAKPGPTVPNVTYLIHHLRTHLLTERPELFMEGDTVCVLSVFFFSGFDATQLRDIGDRVYSSSSMIRIGSWKARARTSSRAVTRSCSSRPCMVADGGHATRPRCRDHLVVGNEIYLVDREAFWSNHEECGITLIDIYTTYASPPPPLASFTYLSIKPTTLFKFCPNLAEIGTTSSLPPISV